MERAYDPIGARLQRNAPIAHDEASLRKQISIFASRDGTGYGSEIVCVGTIKVTKMITIKATLAGLIIRGGAQIVPASDVTTIFRLDAQDVEIRDLRFRPGTTGTVTFVDVRANYCGVRGVRQHAVSTVPSAVRVTIAASFCSVCDCKNFGGSGGATNVIVVTSGTGNIISRNVVSNSGKIDTSAGASSVVAENHGATVVSHASDQVGLNS